RSRLERRRAMLYAVTRCLAESSTVAAAMPPIIQAIGGATGWQLGNYWQVDRQAGVLRCSAWWHIEAERFTTFETMSRDTAFSSGIGLPGRVWASGKPAWIVEVQADANFPRFEAAAFVGLHGACGFPIVAGG